MSNQMRTFPREICIPQKPVNPLKTKGVAGFQNGLMFQPHSESTSFTSIMQFLKCHILKTSIHSSCTFSLWNTILLSSISALDRIRFHAFTLLCQCLCFKKVGQSTALKNGQIKIINQQNTEQEDSGVDYAAEYRKQTGKDLETGEYVTQ